MIKANGLLVLRKPNFNYDKKGRGAFLPYAPKLSGVYYAGIDRMSWFDLDEDFHSNKLPDEFVELRQEMHENKFDFLDYVIAPSIEKAIKLLNYSNKHSQRNELVAIDSLILKKIKADKIPINNDIHWLGVDIYCQGYGSLIREGIFAKPELFPDFFDELNENGLFDLDSVLIDSYIEKYTECSVNNNIERIDGAEEYLDRVAIGRILLSMGQGIE